MEILRTKTLSAQQKEQINLLWDEEYPINLKGRFTFLLDGIENYSHYLIEKDGNVVAWAVEFEKDKEIRFSIIVKNEAQGEGYGKMLIDQLKADLTEFYGWVIDHNNDLKEDGSRYVSPLPFYLKNGFEIQQDIVIDNDILRAVKIKWVSKTS